MRVFLFGVVVGAIAMYLQLEGFGPIIGELRVWWYKAAAPHAAALQQ